MENVEISRFGAVKFVGLSLNFVLQAEIHPTATSTVDGEELEEGSARGVRIGWNYGLTDLCFP